MEGCSELLAWAWLCRGVSTGASAQRGTVQSLHWLEAGHQHAGLGWAGLHSGSVVDPTHAKVHKGLADLGLGGWNPLVLVLYGWDHRISLWAKMHFFCGCDFDPYDICIQQVKGRIMVLQFHVCSSTLH